MEESMQQVKKLCRCGHDKSNPVVVLKNKYSWLGWLQLLTGITTYPAKALYHCTVCKDDFDETTDPAILQKYIN